MTLRQSQRAAQRQAEAAMRRGFAGECERCQRKPVFCAPTINGKVTFLCRPCADAYLAAQGAYDPPEAQVAVAAGAFVLPRRTSADVRRKDNQPEQR